MDIIIEKRSSTFTIYHTEYLYCIRRTILTLLDSISNYNNDRAQYPTFQIYYEMLLS